MATIKVGSIESSDILFVLDTNSKKQKCSIELISMVPDLDDNEIESVVRNALKKFNLLEYVHKVYYNGANEWAILGRCEALSKTLHKLNLSKGK